MEQLKNGKISSRQRGQNQSVDNCSSKALSLSIFKHFAWYGLFSDAQTKIMSCV